VHGSYYSSMCELLRRFQGRDAVRTKGFEEDLEGRLRSVYGDNPCWIGLTLTEAYRSLRNSREQMEPGDFHRRRESLLNEIDVEIAYFRKRLELYVEGDTVIVECRRDAMLLPYPEDVARIVRYETALERQFERKLQQLVAWRREKEQNLPERDLNPAGNVQPQETGVNGIMGNQKSEPIIGAYFSAIHLLSYYYIT